MLTNTICWKTTTPGLKPAWLEGCPDAQNCGVYWWVGDAMVVPDWSTVEWVETSPGWAAAKVVAEIDRARYLRDRKWHMPIVVEDTRGRIWHIPAILAPDGVPAVAQVRRLVDGKWVREFVDDNQEAAVEACQRFRSDQCMDLDEQSNAVLAILSCAYHLDPATMGALGMLDDVLVLHALKAASGLLGE